MQDTMCTCKGTSSCKLGVYSEVSYVRKFPYRCQYVENSIQYVFRKARQKPANRTN